MCYALSAQESIRNHCEKTACRDECKGHQLRKKKKDVAGSGSQADVRSGINKTNTSEASFYVFFLCLLSVCLWLCLRVLLCVVVVSRGVVCVRCVWCETWEKQPCVRSKRPRVYRHHAHMLRKQVFVAHLEQHLSPMLESCLIGNFLLTKKSLRRVTTCTRGSDI